MIKNRKDLQEYLLADQIALGRKKKKTLLSDEIWMYEILLRKCEYYNNISPNIIRKLRGGGIPVFAASARDKMRFFYSCKYMW